MGISKCFSIFVKNNIMIDKTYNDYIIEGFIAYEDLLDCLKDFSENKRDRKIEKTQIHIINFVLLALDCFYGNKNIHFFPLEKDKYFLDRNGGFRYNEVRNKFYDSKTFDYGVQIKIGEKEVNIFFSLKGTNEGGGHQDDVLMEIGKTCELIEKNKDENLYFVFLLDGEYIESQTKYLDKSDKYEVITSDPRRIEGIFRKKITKALKEINDNE